MRKLISTGVGFVLRIPKIGGRDTLFRFGWIDSTDCFIRRSGLHRSLHIKPAWSDWARQRHLGVLAVTLFAGAMIAAPANCERRYYQWVDDQGKTHISDQLPVEAMRRGHRVVDERGMVVEEREAPKTLEELAAERAMERERRRQERKDLELRMTYSNEAQLLEVRDKRLDLADQFIAINSEQLADLEEKLAEVQNQIEMRERQGQNVSPALLREEEALQERIANKQRYLEQRQRERSAIVEQFDTDLKRYREIMGIAAE